MKLTSLVFLPALLPASVLAGTVIFTDSQHLPANLQRKITRRSSFESSLDPAGLPDILAEYEKNLILHALEKNSWNVSKAAEHLNIQRQNLQQRMKKLHIQRPEK